MNIENLIIYKPQSQSAAQRWTGRILTTLAWAFLFYGFFPIVGFIVSRHLLPELPFEYNVTSMGSWSSLVPLLPWWVLSVIVLVGGLYIWATVQFIRFRNSRRSANRALVSTAEMAEHCQHPEEAIKEWTDSRRAVAHYDDQTKMVGVGTAVTEPFREIPRDDEPPAPLKPLAQPAAPAVCGQQRERELEGAANKLRAQLVEYWGKAESLEAVMRDIAENRKTRHNNRDVVLYAEMKKARTVLIESIKKSRQELSQTRFLLEESKAAAEVIGASGLSAVKVNPAPVKPATVSTPVGNPVASSVAPAVTRAPTPAPVSNHGVQEPFVADWSALAATQAALDECDALLKKEPLLTETFAALETWPMNMPTTDNFAPEQVVIPKTDNPIAELMAKEVSAESNKPKQATRPTPQVTDYVGEYVDGLIL